MICKCCQESKAHEPETGARIPRVHQSIGGIESGTGTVEGVIKDFTFFGKSFFVWLGGLE
jgi:hypothetical protein